MAYLAQAITQVLTNAEADKNRFEKSRLERLAREVSRQSEIRMIEQEDLEIQRREFAFKTAFPEIEKQNEAILQFSRQYGGLSRSKEMARNLAILAWWNSQNTSAANSRA